jgi:hypothetical protein
MLMKSVFLAVGGRRPQLLGGENAVAFEDTREGEDVTQHGHGTYPSLVAVPPPSSLITKIGILPNTIPMFHLMVVVMAFCMVRASIRWSHLGLYICCHAEKWLGDVRVYFLHWMHILWM